MLRTNTAAACEGDQTRFERTRRVVVPGFAAIVTVWLVQPGLGLSSTNVAWVIRVRIPFTHIFPFVHWDLIVAFAVAGAMSAVYGAFAVSNSEKQRYIAALFPAFFEILKWIGLIWFPLPAWIDPAHPPYLFRVLPPAASIGYWVVHIFVPAGAAVGVVYFFNHSFRTSRRNHGMDLTSIL